MGLVSRQTRALFFGGVYPSALGCSRRILEPNRQRRSRDNLSDNLYKIY